MEPRDKLLERITGRSVPRRKARRLGTAQRSVKEKEYDDTQTVVQQALQQANGEINQLDPDLDALAQYLTTALKAVLDARDEEEEDDSIIEDTAQGTMLRLGKGIDYDPFFSSTTRRPAQGQSSEDRVKALFNRDLFWGSLLDEEE